MINLFPAGPGSCPALPGHLPQRAGGGGHAEWGGEEGQDILPWLLQALSQEVQGVWWRELQAGAF